MQASLTRGAASGWHSRQQHTANACLHQLTAHHAGAHQLASREALSFAKLRMTFLLPRVSLLPAHACGSQVQSKQGTAGAGPVHTLQKVFAY